MAIWVIMPVYNSQSTLPQALEALQNQDLTPSPHLVLVDNGSTDASRDLLQSALLHGQACTSQSVLLHEPRPGPAAARNHGLRYALEHDPQALCLLLDSDCIPAPTWARTLAQALENHPEWAAVGGPLTSLCFNSYSQEFIERQAIMRVEDFYASRPGKPPFVLTANLAIRAQTLLNHGFFDETLFVGEDCDWCWRIAQQGGKIGFEPSAAVDHRHRSSPWQLARMMFRYGQGSLLLQGRYRELLGPLPWDWITPWRFIRAAIKCLLLPFRSLTPYQKREAPLELIRYGAFGCGRWAGWLGFTPSRK